MNGWAFVRFLTVFLESGPGSEVAEKPLLRLRVHVSHVLPRKFVPTCASLWVSSKLAKPFERVTRGETEAFLSVSTLQSAEERRLLPAPAADEKQALGAAGARHDHHLHRHLEHG